jgi:hypothetical protein
MRAIRLKPLLLVSLFAAACGTPPSQEEVEDAQVKVEAAAEALSQLRGALELLGLLPEYTCGEPRRHFAGKAVEDLRAKAACLSISTQESETSDALRVDYDQVCQVGEHRLAGTTRFELTGGEDRFELTADLRQTELDGKPVQAKAGYGTCSDEKAVWAALSGNLPRRPEVAFEIDGKVAKRDGLPLIGSPTLVLNGPGKLTRTEGVDMLTFLGLEYTVGKYLPHAGTLQIATSDGHLYQVTFSQVLWKLGKAEVQIDDHSPVTVPVVQ